MNMNGESGAVNTPDCRTFTIVKALPIDSIKNALVDSRFSCKNVYENKTYSTDRKEASWMMHGFWSRPPQ